MSLRIPFMKRLKRASKSIVETVLKKKEEDLPFKGDADVIIRPAAQRRLKVMHFTNWKITHFRKTHMTHNGVRVPVEGLKKCI